MENTEVKIRDGYSEIFCCGEKIFRISKTEFKHSVINCPVCKGNHVFEVKAWTPEREGIKNPLDNASQ